MPGEKNSESYATPKPAKIARLSQTESFAGSLTPGSTGTPTGTRNTSSGRWVTYNPDFLLFSHIQRPGYPPHLYAYVMYVIVMGAYVYLYLP